MSYYKAATRTHMPHDQLLRNIEMVDEGEGSDVSDLDIVKATTKEINLLGAFEKSDDTLSSGSDANRKRNRAASGDRIDFSDDDEDPDAAYEKFKRRKTDARKKTAARTRKTKQQAGAKSNPMVGKKQRPLIDRKESQHEKRGRKDILGSDSDTDEAPETSLPQFLKDRKSRWIRDREELGNLVYKVPPDYENVDFSDDDRMEHLEERPVFEHAPCAPYKDVKLENSVGIVPAPIAQYLHPYQITGAEFLHELFVYQRGGLLGDDMGLGKTIQVIAFLTAAFGKSGDERDMKRMRKMRRRTDRWYPKVLIVCPGTLMANWQAEFNKWGYWHTEQFHGVKDRANVLSAAKQGRLEVMITTYGTYRLNRGEINLIEWDCVIADECHQIKERRSEITKAMNEVNALCRIGLTGTAIQNKYDEFWTILNWTNPGQFGSLAEWRISISEPLKIGQSHDSTNAQLAMSRNVANAFVKHLLPGRFLRRMKSLIADQLTKKSDRVVFCPLTDAQSDAYMNLIDSDKIDYIRRSSELCDCSSGKKRGWCCYMEIPGRGKWQHHVFPCLMSLQKLSNHLALLCPQSSDDSERQDKELENLQSALPDRWRDLYANRDQITNFANVEFCGKWKVLRKLLKFWYSNGDKVLVFSHSVRLLRMLQMLFKSTTSYNVSYLDGSMTYPDRAQTVDDFNANPTQFVFLISTRAGGVGLNITSANKVVVFDPNWNPSWDLQAQDRAYRLGQKRDVEVFRLISAGTVEEIVYARQIYKQQQANIAYNASTERRYFRGVQDTADKKGEIFGLVNLFSFEGENLVLRDIVNKTNIAESKAGVSVIGLDTSQDKNSDDEDEDDKGNRAMTLLAAQISEGRELGEEEKPDADEDDENKRKARAVQAILSMAGVVYSHENSEVIGSSRMEAKLSKRAVAAGNDYDLAKEFAFERPGAAAIACNKSFGDEDDDKYKHKPPEQVRRRQFCSIAEFYGFKDATEFALVIEGWSRQKRTDCLDRFYTHRKKVLELGSGDGDDDNEDMR